MFCHATSLHIGVLCDISAGYAATCFCIAGMFVTSALCDTNVLSHTVCGSFRYIISAFHIHVSWVLHVWHELMPIETVG